MIKAEKVCEYLNKIHAIDESFLTELVSNRIEVSKEITKTDVMCSFVSKNGRFEAGVIGLINGMVTDGYVSANYDDNGKLVNFTVVRLRSAKMEKRKSGFYWVKTAMINSGKWFAAEYSNEKWIIGSGITAGDEIMDAINENCIMSPDEWE